MSLLSQMSQQDRCQFWEIKAPTVNFCPAELAEICQTSLRQLERYFRVDLGRSPREWLAEQRIKHAGALLLSAQSIKEVSYQLGFKQPSHFCREFKRWYGTTPTKYCSLS